MPPPPWRELSEVTNLTTKLRDIDTRHAAEQASLEEQIAALGTKRAENITRIGTLEDKQRQLQAKGADFGVGNFDPANPAAQHRWAWISRHRPLADHPHTDEILGLLDYAYRECFVNPENRRST